LAGREVLAGPDRTILPVAAMAPPDCPDPIRSPPLRRAEGRLLSGDPLEYPGDQQRHVCRSDGRFHQRAPGAGDRREAEDGPAATRLSPVQRSDRRRAFLAPGLGRLGPVGGPSTRPAPGREPTRSEAIVVRSPWSVVRGPWCY